LNCSKSELIRWINRGIRKKDDDDDEECVVPEAARCCVWERNEWCGSAGKEAYHGGWE
jgi:hypothetical protein